MGSPGSPLPQVGQWIVDFVALGLSCCLSPVELREQARRCWGSVTLSAACVECNLDQIHALCLELERDYGIRATGVETESLGSPAAVAALEAADLVVTTRFHDDAVRSAVGVEGPPLVVVSLNETYRAELARVLAVERLYLLCSDPRFAAKVPLIFEGRDNVRPVVVGLDDLARLPAHACFDAMPRALERLPANWRPNRLIRSSRVFSMETARELVAHVVRINLEAAARAQP